MPRSSHRLYRALATLALGCVLTRAQASGNGNDNGNGSSCDPTSFTENFSNGIEERWEQLAGAEHKGSLTTGNNGGLQLALREGGNTVTQIRSRALFTTAEIGFTLQTNSKPGVMYSFVVWPAANERALGEIDLEMLGGGDDRMLRVPIWAPGHGDQEYIGLSNAPGSWEGDPQGPNADWGAAEPYSSANCVTLSDFDQTASNPFHLSIQEDRISWTVNEQTFATFTRGEDSSEWPLGERPMMISISLWSDPGEANWMGEYNYNEQDPPTLAISDVSFEGCVTSSGDSGTDEDPDGSGSHEEEEGAEHGQHEEGHGGEEEEEDPPIESDNPFGASDSEEEEEEEEEHGYSDSMSGSDGSRQDTSIENEYTTVWESGDKEDLEGMDGDEEEGGGGDGVVTENGSGGPDETEQEDNEDSSSASTVSYAGPVRMFAAATMYTVFFCS